MTKPKSETKTEPRPKTEPKAEPAAATPATPASLHTTRAYVDGLEAGKARLLLEDQQGEWQTYHLPASALPQDAKEGSWLELGARSITAPTEFDSRIPRAKLGRSDRGGDFSL